MWWAKSDEYLCNWISGHLLSPSSSDLRFARVVAVWGLSYVSPFRILLHLEFFHVD
jgi:hypothetical protein